MEKLKEIFRKEAVLCIAVILAVISSFVVLPDKEYIGYIDFRTLAILFCLMSVMAGLQKLGVFQWTAEKLLSKVSTGRQLGLILVLLCFVFSMLITNDVALITFVPFTFIVLKLMGEGYMRRLSIPVVVLQTIAANLGSMLTPIGNPQNLYLYGKAGISLGAFLLLMLPYTIVSLVLVLVGCLLLGSDKNSELNLQVKFEEKTVLAGSCKQLVVYLLLFVFCLLTVAHVVNVWVTLGVVVAVFLVMDRKLLKKVDYALLLTFVGFFIFIGNMGRIPVFYDFLQSVVAGNEVITAVIASQAISNVPAALLLSGFTDHCAALIIGTNLGGLGTLIASMASLISYKYISKECEEGVIGTKGRYLAVFTAANIVFLVVLLAVYLMIGSGG